MCRRAVEMWCLLTVVMLTLCADQHRADDVLIPALSEFPTESMSAFNPSSTDYYHSLFVDSHNDGVLFLGAQDRMFKLNAKNISINYVESVNLTASGEFFDRFIQNRKNCGRNHGRKDEQEQGVHCANHIRTIYRVANSNEIYVCGTGAYSPQEFYLNDKLELIATANRGRAKCPHDPTAVYVFAYVTQGNPENIPALYTAVAIDGIPADFAILRPDLYYNRTSTSRSGTLLRTEPDAKWINTAGAVYVVGVFDIGEYVFYFFRELAYEASNYCGKTYYSRVARICKQDQGGRGIEFTTMFTSFLKARLICSIPGTVPYYFNEIYDVQYNASSGTFYALFQANSDGPWGSAVCKFSLSDINNLFNTGVYLGRDNVESAWLPPPAEKFPKDIHPGQCANNSKDLALSTYIYKKLYPLMKDPVTPSGGHPMYYSNQIAFTKLQVDHMSKYTILYLYSKGLAEVHQVAVWNNSRQYETVSKWRPFASIQAASSPLTVWTMLLHTVDQNKWLYLAADVAVIQLNTEQCQLYTKCFDCIRDPHCGWNTEELRCQRYQSGYDTCIFNCIWTIVANSHCSLSSFFVL